MSVSVLCVIKILITTLSVLYVLCSCNVYSFWLHNGLTLCGTKHHHAGQNIETTHTASSVVHPMTKQGEETSAVTCQKMLLANFSTVTCPVSCKPSSLHSTSSIHIGSHWDTFEMQQKSTEWKLLTIKQYLWLAKHVTSNKIVQWVVPKQHWHFESGAFSEAHNWLSAMCSLAQRCQPKQLEVLRGKNTVVFLSWF